MGDVTKSALSETIVPSNVYIREFYKRYKLNHISFYLDKEDHIKSKVSRRNK